MRRKSCRVWGLVCLAIWLTAEAVCGQTHPRKIQNSLGMVFVFIPAGSFLMGSRESPEEVVRKGGGKADELKREHPCHHVEITRGFYFKNKEVTTGEFAVFVKATGYLTTAEVNGYSWVWQGEWKRLPRASWRYPLGLKSGAAVSGRHPVVHVSWKDASAFCRWLSVKEGRNYRLPKEAEWEYACRAGTTTPFFWGETISTDQANYDGNYTYGNGHKGVYRKKTMPVGSFPTNAWAIHDMHGNVWEWCADRFSGDYYHHSPSKDPKGPSSGKYRVLRGGSWYNHPRILRSALRFGKDPSHQDDNLGFRVVMDY